MSIYKEGDIIKGKTMTLLVKQMYKEVHYCTEVCAFGGKSPTGKRTCSLNKLCKELDIKSIACRDLIGFCYFKEIKGGV